MPCREQIQKNPIKQKKGEQIFFSHENIYHWAMLALYGETYWLIHPECEKLPDSYEKWVENALSRHSLDDCYEFMSKNNNVTNKA